MPVMKTPPRPGTPELNKNGNPRLNAAIGNGVCPPQAAAALTELLAQLPAGHY